MLIEILFSLFLMLLLGFLLLLGIWKFLLLPLFLPPSPPKKVEEQLSRLHFLAGLNSFTGVLFVIFLALLLYFRLFLWILPVTVIYLLFLFRSKCAQNQLKQELWAKGWKAYRAEEYTQAKQIFSSLLSAHKELGDFLDPSEKAEALFALGQSLEKLGECEKAFDVYKQYLEDFPSGVYKKEIEEKISLLKKKEKKEVSLLPSKREAKLAELVASVKRSPFSSSTLNHKEGQKIGNYILLEPLGQGGFGEVWKAKHHLLEEKIVTLRLPLGEKGRENLQHLAQVQSRLSSPHIVQVFDLSLETEPPYLVLEYVDGCDLKQIIQSCSRREELVEPAFALLWGICQALLEAHSKGVIHCDLKPSNILIQRKGFVKVTDFELSSFSSSPLSLSIRDEEDSSVKGSLPYMAPEQLRGEKPDERTDIYAVGVVLFEFLTGRLPEPGDSLLDGLENVSPEWQILEEIFQNSYTKREKRFQSVQEILALFGGL